MAKALTDGALDRAQGSARAARSGKDSSAGGEGGASRTQHLIHIGFPKTGSNFLRRWFSAHPQLAFTPGGIAGFSDVYDIARQSVEDRTRTLYRVTSAEGLATPHADVGAHPGAFRRTAIGGMPAAQAEVCATLRSLFADVWILIVTRGFRSMILSAYSQYVRSGGEEPFERFCRLLPARVEASQNPWNYDYLIGMYREAFGREKVIVLPYELLCDQPADFTRAIESRLGLVESAPDCARVNPSLSPIELAWYPRLTRRLRALPVSGRLRASIERRYLAWIFRGRLRRLVHCLQRLRPLSLSEGAELAPEIIAAFAATSQFCRTDPHFQPYATDYGMEAGARAERTG